jgi:hypothetical protein
MASIQRANPHLEEIIEMLDQHLARNNGDVGLAMSKLTKSENEWIDDEIVHCMVDPRYFISNYYAYRDEKEGFRGLYPLFDSQEILCEEYRKLEKAYGKVRALVLKARQMGSTTYNDAEFFHKTIWKEHTNSIIVAQDEDQSSYIMGMYESALDFLPYWMKPRKKSFGTGQFIEFDERDEYLRSVKPGLKSWIYADNARKPSGVGRGKTFGRALLSELAFWENGSQLSKSLFPTMNTPDGFYIMESTANGRNDFWHNLWRRAEAGKVDWHPIFIPFYRREVTYSLPILKTEVFVVTDEEKAIRERVYEKESFLVKDETFKWMRNKKEEFVAIDGDDSMFSQEYTSEPEESFQSSAITAFPRAIIRRFSKLTKNPEFTGEIKFDVGTGYKLFLNPVGRHDIVPYPESENRFHVWKKPERGRRYAMGVDVGLGNEGGDYSCIQVIRLSEAAHERDEQVACWHGLVHPTALAGIICAVGFYYNEALAAVEVNSFGMATNSILMREYEYENVYRFKRLDRVTNFITNIAGFLSTANSTDALMARMAEGFLEDSIIINCRFTMDEFNDYTEEGAQGDGAHDDYVDALLIALYCGHEGEVRSRQEGKSKKVDKDLITFHVKDRFDTIVLTTNSQTEAETYAKKHIGSTIERDSGATAHVTIGGRKFKVPADFQNTDHSPIHDKTGTAHRLHYEEGVAEEDITPEMIQEAEEMEQANEDDPEAWKYV